MLIIVPADQKPAVRVAESLSFLINKLAQHAGRGMTEALEPLGVQPRESGVLAALAQFGPMSQQRLGELLVIDRTTMVLSIDRLEELRLVQRAADPRDRRSFSIELTPKGVAAVAECQRRLEAFEDALLAPLPRKERARFRQAVYRLVEGRLVPEVRVKGRR